MHADGQGSLDSRWMALWNHLGVLAGRGPAFEIIRTAYSVPGRHYHTLTHIVACLDELDVVRPLCRDADAVETALWYHDLVYDPSRADNEERSALAAADALRT